MVRDVWLPLVWSVSAYFLVGWGTGQAQWGTDANSPTHTVNRLVASISRQPHVVASSDKSSAAASLDAALALIDLRGVSQKTLGQHWTQLQPTEQDEFMALFAQLLIRIAFPQSAAFFQELAVTVSGERIRGPEATVSTYVKHAKEGQIDIDYRLIQQDRGWLVSDIELDGVSLSRNLRAQFHQIIRQDSYLELLRRMREKLEHAIAASAF